MEFQLKNILSSSLCRSWNKVSNFERVACLLGVSTEYWMVIESSAGVLKILKYVGSTNVKGLSEGKNLRNVQI